MDVDTLCITITFACCDYWLLNKCGRLKNACKIAKIWLTNQMDTVWFQLHLRWLQAFLWHMKIHWLSMLNKELCFFAKRKQFWERHRKPYASHRLLATKCFKQCIVPVSFLVWREVGGGVSERTWYLFCRNKHLSNHVKYFLSFPFCSLSHTQRGESIGKYLLFIL